MTMPGTADGYEFRESIPLDPLPPGSTVLVTGPADAAAREVALHLSQPHDDSEASLLIATTTDGDTLSSQCRNMGGAFSEERLRIIECTGKSYSREETPPWLRQLSGPDALSAIGMEFSSLLDELATEGFHRVRTGLLSVSRLLMAGEFQTVSRFINILSGRIEATEGLGILHIDTTTQDQRVVAALEKLCDGRIDVRMMANREQELRTQGLDGQVERWTTVAIDRVWPRGIGRHLLTRTVSMSSGARTDYSCIRCGYKSSGSLELEALARNPCQ